MKKEFGNYMTINGLIDNEDRVKEYGYDSLCLRYNIARDAQAEWDIAHKHMDNERAYQLAQRDKLKFYQILDDLIGEHK